MYLNKMSNYDSNTTSLYYGKKKCLKSIGHADAAYIIQMEITWSLIYVHAQEIIYQNNIMI